jgi:hypothetical protein
VTISLERLQHLSASGARAVEAFAVDDLDLLAVPQLAVDAPGTPTGMNGSDSNTDLIVCRRAGDRYEHWSTLAHRAGKTPSSPRSRTALAGRKILRGKAVEALA